MLCRIKNLSYFEKFLSKNGDEKTLLTYINKLFISKSMSEENEEIESLQRRILTIEHDLFKICESINRASNDLVEDIRELCILDMYSNDSLRVKKQVFSLTPYLFGTYVEIVTDVTLPVLSRTKTEQLEQIADYHPQKLSELINNLLLYSTSHVASQQELLGKHSMRAMNSHVGEPLKFVFHIYQEDTQEYQEFRVDLTRDKHNTEWCRFSSRDIDEVVRRRTADAKSEEYLVSAIPRHAGLSDRFLQASLLSFALEMAGKEIKTYRELGYPDIDPQDMSGKISEIAQKAAVNYEQDQELQRNPLAAIAMPSGYDMQ